MLNSLPETNQKDQYRRGWKRASEGTMLKYTGVGLVRQKYGTS